MRGTRGLSRVAGGWESGGWSVWGVRVTAEGGAVAGFAALTAGSILLFHGPWLRVPPLLIAVPGVLVLSFSGLALIFALRRPR